MKYIIIHCSDSPFGDADLIDQWHRQRGWSQIGYHYVVLNGKRHGSDSYDEHDDGLVEAGRMESVKGAHARGYNADSIGVCLIGRDGEFSDAQMAALFSLVASLCIRYSISTSGVIGHYELDSGKSCPDLLMGKFRTQLGRITQAIKKEVRGRATP